MDDIANNPTLAYTFDDDCDCVAEEINVTEISEEETPWSQTTIRCMLEECLKKKKDLHDHRHRKNKFFPVIRERLIERGYHFSVKTLEKKFHNLKKHFCTICQHKDRATAPTRPITWPYYDLMMEIFAEELQIEDAPTMASLYPDPEPPKNLVLVKSLKAAMSDSESEIESASDCELGPVVDDDEDDGLPESIWTHKTVTAFLRECYKRRFDLWNPHMRRRQTFSIIRQRLKAKGYNLYQDTLDRKLRNMKAHYQSIVDNVPQNGSVCFKRKRAKWPYFEMMDEIYGKAMANDVSHLKRAVVKAITPPVPPNSLIQIPETTMKFRRIAPKPDPDAVQPAPALPQIAQIYSFAPQPQPQQLCNATVAALPMSLGEFDESYLECNDENFEEEQLPIKFEMSMPANEKPIYVEEKVKFSLDILALEERRTIVSEQMLEEFVESNRIREQLVQFKRKSLARAMARAKRKNNGSLV